MKCAKKSNKIWWAIWDSNPEPITSEATTIANSPDISSSNIFCLYQQKLHGK